MTMTLRRALRRALNAMTTGGAPVAWPADPVTMTTEQARLALGVGTHTRPMPPEADPESLAAAEAWTVADVQAERVRVRDEVAAARAELEDTRRHLRGTEAMLRAAQVRLEQQTLNTARLTRDLALRTTQRDKARSDRDRLQVALNRLRDQVDPEC